MAYEAQPSVSLMFSRETYLPLHYKIWRDGQVVFVEQSRASLVGDYFPYSPYNITPELDITVTRIRGVITN